LVDYLELLVFDPLPEHLMLVFGSLLISLLLALPLAILCLKNKHLKTLIIGFANLIQAIPSFAVLALVVPLLGIGFTPALFAIILRMMLPIIKNTYIGLTTIDTKTLEYAKGLGLTDRQILFQIRFPNAYPAFFSGVKFAAVLANSLAILSAIIGAGGFGVNVFKYIHQYNIQSLIYSIIPVILIAVGLEITLILLEKKLTPVPLQKS